MTNQGYSTLLTRRRFTQLSGMAAGSALLGAASGAATPPDVALEIAPYTLEASPKHHIRTVAYNGQVPGPLLRMRQGREQTVEVRNLTSDPEVVHWHGLFLPSEIDGAMEEGTPMIAPGTTARYTFKPDPPGFRWFHTHTFAGKDLGKAQYGGQHGFLMIEPRENAGHYDREVFLGLHDWGGHMFGGDDGSMNPVYDISTINGKMLGAGDPVRVKQGERVLMHVLNSSPTEVHWIALAGHSFHVIALDGNLVPQPRTVPMLRLAPAERVTTVVEMNAPGVWVLGEVRKHVQAAGMGVVIEYAGAADEPVWTQPNDLVWDYRQFAASGETNPSGDEVVRIDLAFDSKFQGHGKEELWRINGKSYPQTDEPILKTGQRYRLVLKNLSADDHPMHLHRHTFEVRKLDGASEMHGLRKDVVLVPSKTTAEVEFVADNPGRTLFHCHQQDHMDRGFMMVFRYA
ncbi:multicopper oxidase family protein [Tunturibacter empetritectus]|uniref:FtsP/CotA-like multicopper oxidase with cupredoxin domain n=1 Tax=Tunturiibacter lichenicola TaxID=2051959 RepID=A0A7W8JCE7_9BACT|nr:multicopper oxidase domain-containing protein [Edaphobacter lichenicola]MBB5345456.1 FtsP/CotA-like multicopper oxidase with cupredoxin domain [Edaphobacter lichenicola]